MTPEEQDKVKSARLRYFAVLSIVLVVLACAVLVNEYGLPFGSQLANYQRQAETIAAPLSHRTS